MTVAAEAFWKQQQDTTRRPLSTEMKFMRGSEQLEWRIMQVASKQKAEQNFMLDVLASYRTKHSKVVVGVYNLISRWRWPPCSSGYSSLSYFVHQCIYQKEI